jgi:hypothetical protein
VSLSGHLLVRPAPDVTLTDLSTGQTHTLATGAASDFILKGDTLVWLVRSRILGIKLNEPGATPKQLVGEDIRQGDHAVTLAIAGDWLVWSNPTGPKAGTLSAERLNEAFGVRP